MSSKMCKNNVTTKKAEMLDALDSIKVYKYEKEAGKLIRLESLQDLLKSKSHQRTFRPA